MKYLIVRYFKDEEKPTKDDVIVKYFYSEELKKYVFERSWDYRTMILRLGIVSFLEFIDEFYDFIQNGMLFSTTIFRNEPLEKYKKGADFEIYKDLEL